MLEVLARNRGMTLSQIHRETGLAKSTLRRLLATLVSRRFVRQSMADKRFRATVTLPDISVSPVPAGMALVADIGLSHGLTLTKKVGWPSDIHIFEHQWMRIVESTRSVSPFSLYQGQIDRRLSIFGSATGLACLSQMQEGEVRQLFEDRTIESRFRPERFSISWQNLKKSLKATRENGYGTRHPNYYGETVINDKLSAIAVPLKREETICGAITLLWPRVLMPAAEFAKLYLQDLKETAAGIEAEMQSYDVQARKRLATVHRPS